MSLKKIHDQQPEYFEFTKENISCCLFVELEPEHFAIWKMAQICIRTAVC